MNCLYLELALLIIRVESFVSHFDELRAGVKSKKSLFQNHFSWTMVIANDVSGSKMLHSKLEKMKFLHYVKIFQKLKFSKS